MASTSAEFRHSMRGLLNALKLCVSALELPLDRSEKLGFLSDIEDSAERLSVLLQEFEMARDAEPAPAEAKVR